ncbi:MAG: rod-binding protein [Rhodospirillaceae bacterium]
MASTHFASYGGRVPAPTLPPGGAAKPRSGSSAGTAGGKSSFTEALDRTEQADKVAASGGRPAGLALNGKSEAETRAAIHKAAGSFESQALGQLLGFMTQGVEVDPTFGGGHGEEMFRDLLNTEYGKLVHKAGTAGIAKSVEREMLRAQGLASNQRV